MNPASDSEHMTQFILRHVVDDRIVDIRTNSFQQKVFNVHRYYVGTKQNHLFRFYGVTLVANSLQTFDELNNEFGNILSSVALQGHCYLHRVRYELTKAGKLHLHACIECPPIKYYKEIPHTKGFGRQFITLRTDSDVKAWLKYICKRMQQESLGELLVDYWFRHHYGFRSRPKTANSISN